MKPAKSFFAVLILVMLGFTARTRAAEVRGWEGTIDLPTYLLGEEDPNPAFPLISRHQIYPYTMLDDLTDQREVKTYQAIYLENDYLKATILPEVGGRLYSLYDKISQREVFYRNHVVKYGLVALRGAWISGGIEFDFPNGHTVVTVSHVASRLVTNADGSATAIVGGMDWVTGMYWQVALTLRAGQARLEQHVTLFNPTPTENLYWYWANAAVPATQDMQFIYPMREANPHSRTEIWSYPVWKGVDYSWYKDIRQPTSLFGRQVRREFFGAYYHDSDYGVVHAADYREVPGKKIWSWGVAGDGLIWTDLLTDHDGAYNEIQAGRYETQLNQEFMPPQRVESWTEYWYPVRGLEGGFVEATNALALNVNFIQLLNMEPKVARLVLDATEDISGATIRASVGGKVVREFGPVDFSPAKTQQFNVPTEELDTARKSLVVDVLSHDGHTLLHWSAADPIDGNKEFVPAAGGHRPKTNPQGQMTAEELFARGVEQEKDGNPLGAAKTYEEVLKRNPKFVPALLKLAYRACEAANFTAALQKIDRARRELPADPGMQYAAGVVHRAAGQWAEAEKAFQASAVSKDHAAPALVQLGELMIREKKYDEATKDLIQALGAEPQDALASVDLAVALRLSGQKEEARQAATRAVTMMPLFPPALAEAWRNDLPGAANSLKEVLSFDSQNFLDVAAWYRGLGDLASSDAVLEEAERDFSTISPLVFYYLASNAREEGKPDRAAQFLKEAASAPAANVFPQRLADAVVLEDAVAHNPGDAHAHYFLGTFLFAHDRYDDAAREWLAAKNAGLEDAVLERNLGVYAWRVKNDLHPAAMYYEKAIQLTPEQYRLYPDLDEIYVQLGDTAKRKQLFAHAPQSVLDRDTVRVRRALLHIQEGEFDEALALLQGHDFKPWEGGAIVRQIFVLANLTEGKSALAAKNPAEAETAFRRALEYPKNLGVGKPNKPHDEEAWYWLGVALADGGKKEEAQNAWKEAAQEGSSAGGAAAVFAAGAMMKLGETAEAEKILSTAGGSPRRGNAEAYSFYVAGLAAQLQSREDEAQKNFARALELDPQLWQARFELNRSAVAR